MRSQNLLKILFIFTLFFLCTHAIAQDTSLLKGIYFQIGNGHARFPKQEIILGSDLKIRTLGLDLWKHTTIEAGVYQKLKKIPLSFFGGIGYSRAQHHVQYINYLVQEDWDQFNSPTFQIYSSLPVHQRLTGNFSARAYPLKCFFVQAGISGKVNIFTYKGSDYEREYKFDPGKWETYGPLFLWPNNMNKWEAAANFKLGFEWRGLFLNYFYEQGLTDMQGPITFRGNDYHLNFGRNINQGIEIGFIKPVRAWNK